MDWAATAAIAACLQTLLLLAAALVAWRQLRYSSLARKDAERIRREESRAYVVVQFDLTEDRFNTPDILLTNLGRTAATNIRVRFDPPLRSSLYEVENLGMFRAEGIPSLMPGQRVSTLFDSMIHRPREWEMKYLAQVTYTDVFGEVHQEDLVIDLSIYMAATKIGRRGIHEIHSELEKLRKSFEKFRTGWGDPLPVVVETRAEHEERSEQLYAEHLERIANSQAAEDTES